jgi:hypothetical protein
MKHARASLKISGAGHVGRRMPMSLLCRKLGEDFELFSDRVEDDVASEIMISDLVSMHDAELAE